MATARRSRVALRGAMLLAVAGCATAGFERPEVAHMYAHFSNVGRIQTAVIQGRIDGARDPARWLARHAADGLPPGSEPYAERMQDLAAEVARAEDIEEMAAATSRLGRTCGACHAALDAGPTYRIVAPATAGVGTAARMIRHIWGADRMWEGLLGPSEEAWTIGTRTLAEAALIPSNLDVQEQDEIRRLEERVRTLTEDAAWTEDWDARAELMGRIMSSCAGCHQRLGIDRR